MGNNSKMNYINFLFKYLYYKIQGSGHVGNIIQSIWIINIIEETPNINHYRLPILSIINPSTGIIKIATILGIEIALDACYSVS